MGRFAFCNISKLGFLVWPKESIVEDFIQSTCLLKRDFLCQIKNKLLDFTSKSTIWSAKSQKEKIFLSYKPGLALEEHRTRNA